jgi:DNA-binding transcriptional ArsR family regulator
VLVGREPESARLHALADPAAAELLRAAAGRDTSVDELDRAVRAGGGSPLYLRELARLPGSEPVR